MVLQILLCVMLTNFTNIATHGSSFFSFTVTAAYLKRASSRMTLVSQPPSQFPLPFRPWTIERPDALPLLQEGYGACAAPAGRWAL